MDRRQNVLMPFPRELDKLNRRAIECPVMIDTIGMVHVAYEIPVLPIHAMSKLVQPVHDL
jgi:hypothetical protein